MRKIVFVILCILSAHNVMAQSYSVRNRGKVAVSDSVSAERSTVNSVVKYEEDHYSTAELFARAGKMQRRSATMRTIAISSVAAGGLVAGFGYKQKPLLGIGIGLGVVGVVSEVMSINYQYKSGICLEATANGIRLKF